MGFRSAKRLNTQFTFYFHVDLPSSYTTHLLDPIKPLSLNFTTQISICKNTVEQRQTTSNKQFLKITAAQRSWKLPDSGKWLFERLIFNS